MAWRPRFRGGGAALRQFDLCTGVGDLELALALPDDAAEEPLGVAGPVHLDPAVQRAVSRLLRGRRALKARRRQPVGLRVPVLPGHAPGACVEIKCRAPHAIDATSSRQPRPFSTRVGAALLLPQRAFVPAVVALQVAESHVRGRAGLQPGVVVRLNGHERLQELARRGAARQRHTMMARREAPLGPRAFFKRPRSLPTTGAEQRASERRGPSCGLFARATGASFARNLTSSPRKGPCSRTAPVRLHPGLSVRETEAC